MAQYRKKPVVVDAERFRPDDTDQHLRHGIRRRKRGMPTFFGTIRAKYAYTIDTRINRRAGSHLPGTRAKIVAGDWIITGVEGERYPCNPVIFRKTYEAVL